MDIMEPEVMIRQVEDLATLHREQVKPIDRQVRAVLDSNQLLSLHRVYLTGDGDSFHAALAAELAFELLTGLPCEPMSAMRFREYGADFMLTAFPADTLVVGITSSGGTLRVAECLQRAASVSDKAITVALTGTPGSRITENAAHTILAEVPSMGRSPGIRTYTATLMGLLLLAIRIGEVRGRYHNTDANAMRNELSMLADGIAATVEANREVTRAAAEALATAPHMLWAGSGPSFGTAMFSAAKVVEASGLFSVGQDLEEWSHVERFAYPDNMPTFVIAPPGRSYKRAADLARQAKELGRTLIAVVSDQDDEIAPIADYVFPIVGSYREEFSPLAYHIPSNMFASHLAETLGRKLFQTDSPRAEAGRVEAARASAHA